MIPAIADAEIIVLGVDLILACQAIRKTGLAHIARSEGQGKELLPLAAIGRAVGDAAAMVKRVQVTGPESGVAAGERIHGWGAQPSLPRSIRRSCEEEVQWS